MRLRVEYSVVVEDVYRLALSHHYGRTHKATRHELLEHFKWHGTSMDDDLIYEYQRDMEDNNQEVPS